MLIFLLAPKKPGLVPADSHCVRDHVAPSCRYVALLLDSYLSVISFRCQCHLMGACLEMMKIMTFSALPRLSLWYQLFTLRLGEDRKPMLVTDERKLAEDCKAF